MPVKTVTASKLIEQLYSIGHIRVWSLAVTVIGDLSSHAGGNADVSAAAVEGTILNALFQRMGVKPEALRVALHRLRKEGWIFSEKNGRTSRYQLSATGRDETRAVWDRVYLPEQGIDSRWQTVIYESSPATQIDGAVKLSSNSYIVCESNKSVIDNPVVNCLSYPVAASSLPSWVEEKILISAHGGLAESLGDVLNGFDAASVDKSDNLDLLAIRMLSLHHWRRIALKPSSWLHMQQFEHGVIRQCHDRVHGVLNELKGIR